MSEVICNITGIKFTVEDNFNSTLIMQHPMASLNTIKKHKMDFEKGRVPTNLAIGALIALLQRHKLLQVHDTWSVLDMHSALMAGFTKRTSNSLVLRLMGKDKELADARKSGLVPKFSIDSVYPAIGERPDLAAKFTPAFKLWVNQILPQENLDLVMLTEAESIQIQSNKFIATGIELADGTLLDFNHDEDALLRLYETEAAKIARRKPITYTQHKLKTLVGLVSSDDYDFVLTPEQKIKLGKLIKQGIMPANVRNTCKQAIKHALAKQETGFKKLKLIQLYAWLEAYTMILCTPKGSINLDAEPSSSEKVKHSNGLSLVERLAKLKRSK